MKRINRWLVRMLAGLLIAVQFLTLLPPVAYAASAGSTTAVKWTDVSPNSIGGTYYDIYDDGGNALTGRYPYPQGCYYGHLGNTFNGSLDSFDLPDNCDPLDPSSYVQGIHAKIFATYTSYIFSNLSLEGKSVDYSNLQFAEIYYTYQGHASSTMAPNTALLRQPKYFYIPVKGVQSDVRYVREDLEWKLDENGKPYTETIRKFQRYQQTFTAEEESAIRALYPVFIEKITQINAMAGFILSQNEAEAGGYHPQLGFYLQKMDDRNRDVMNPRPWSEDDFYDAIQDAGMSAEQAEMYVNQVLDGIAEWVEENRIASPDITSFEIAGSKGRIDTKTHTVSLRKPLGAVWSGADAAVSSSRDTCAQLISGSVGANDDRLIYQVTPYCPYSGYLYNGWTDRKGGEYTDLSQEWTVIIEPGDPYNELVSFGFYDQNYGKVRYGTINTSPTGVGSTVTINMPVGTDLTHLTPLTAHLGQYVQIQNTNGTWETIQEETSCDFSSPRTIRVVNDAYHLTTEYTVSVTAAPSAECDILDYRIGYQQAEIDQASGSITIEVPYDAVLGQTEPVLTVSDFASVTRTPANLEINTPLTYEVTAENGTAKKAYTVIIKRTPPSAGNDILEFSYGALAGEFSETSNNIRMTVPYGTDLSALAPTIVTSEFATVSPRSGAPVDFSDSADNPVRYIVTAQNGDRKEYHVTITRADKPTEPLDAARLNRVKNNITARYKGIRAGEDHDGRVVYDDWELMNLGFAECREPVKPGDPLPYGLNIYDQIAELAPNKMTDYARIIMMLTALGIDATQLDQYGDGEPFKDASGKVIHNLVEELYRFDKTATINGPIFTLIAYDMGNYTVPADARWTRAVLLEEVLSHPYGSDGWGIDMVAMLMQCLYPYINDPVYGARVRAKLQEGYDIILGYESASSVDPMNPDYSFYSWSTLNSEAAAQVICAMCVMGIDVGTNPSFADVNNGKGVIPSWLNNFLMPEETGFGHTNNGYNAMATYQSMYALQWYLAFFENGGEGFPYSLYYRRFDFSRPLSKECDILRFTLEGQEGIISNRDITVAVPSGMPLKDLTPEMELSAGAKLLAPEPPMDFVAGSITTVTIQAEDGTTTKMYSVKPVYDDSVQAKGTELKIDSIIIYNEDIAQKDITGIEVASGADGITEVLITIVPGVDTGKLRFKADLSYRATANIDVTGKENQDLSTWTPVTITAEDGSTRQYRLMVYSSEFASISEFFIAVDGVEYGAAITAVGDNGTIRFSGIPTYADLTRVTPSKVTLGPGTTELLPSDKTPQNYVEGAEYTVKGEGLITRTYNVVVNTSGGSSTDPGGTDTPVNNSFAITSFKINGVKGEINDSAGVIVVTLPYGTNTHQLVPEIETGSGCTVSPLSGQVVDLSLPVEYTVKRGKEQRVYHVAVVLEKSPAQLMWEELERIVDPVARQTSRDTTYRPVEQKIIPSTDAILAGMRLLRNGDRLDYTAVPMGTALVVTPADYQAGQTCRFRAEKGALGNLAANGYSSFDIQAGVLRLSITEKMDTAKGLDLTLGPASAAAQAAWKKQKGAVGLWNIQCASVAGGLNMRIDCAGAEGELALARYNSAANCFEVVAAKRWIVEAGVLTASQLSPGVYGIIRLS